MGNIGSSSGGGDGDGDGGSGRRRHGRRRNHTLSVPPPSPPLPQPPTSEIPHNRYVFAAATPYPNPNPNQYNHYPGYYPPPPGTIPGPLPAPYDHHHHHHYPPQPYHHWAAVGRYHCGSMMPPPLPFVEHQKAVTIRNDVNLKRETLRLESDPEYPGRFLVSFTFDATVPGRITVVCFAEEGEECCLIPTKEDILPPIVENFEKGLCQKFIQPSGTGIDLAAFEDLKAAFEDLKAADTNIYPLAIKAETVQAEGGSGSGSMNAQITQAMYEKEKGKMKIKVMKQILWVNKMRYELQEIYGIGNTVDDGDDDDDDVNASDRAKECVICLSEPRDTTVLPCRHMCLCNGCAKVLRFQTNRCPICRQPVERLLEIKVNNGNNGDSNGGGDEPEELSTTSH